MRAVRYDGSAVFLSKDHPEPELRPGEAIVRTTRVGIDASDLAVARGEIPFEGVIGHQFVGVVERVGPGDDGGKAMERRRVVGSPAVVCGRCETCRGGLSAHCPHRAVLGLLGRDGCFAERFAAPLVNLEPIPDGLDDDAAVFAQPLADALHASRIIRIEGKPYVTVLGDDAGALLCAQVMARMNASVRVLGDRPARFNVCEKWGVKHRHWDEVGRRQDQDVVVECTGTPEGIDLAMRLVRPRGKIVLRSPVMPLPGGGGGVGGVDLAPAIRAELELIGARAGPIEPAVAALAGGRVDVLSMITGRARLEDGVGALRTASEPDQIRVVVDAG